MSTATLDPCSVLMNSSVGLRPRAIWPVCPSTMWRSASSSSTRRPIAPRRIFIRRARSAREIGWWLPISVSAICRLMCREVRRVATWNRFGSIRRILSQEGTKYTDRRQPCQSDPPRVAVEVSPQSQDQLEAGRVDTGLLALTGYHAPRHARIRLAYLGGVVFLRERFRRTAVSNTAGIPPVIPASSMFSDDTTTTFRPAVAVGFDAEISLTSHVAVVPQLRVVAPSAGLSIRPGVAVRWTS